MHTRSEPRFHVQSAVKVAAVDQPEEVSAAVLLDVSGSGMKIISDHDWPVGSRLVVEMENHLVLARVRNSQARGPKFSLGAETLHSTLKLMLPDAPRAEWHKILLEEAGDTGEPAVTSPVAAPEAESEEFWNKPEPPWSDATSVEPEAMPNPAEHITKDQATPSLSDASPHDTEPLDERALDAQTLALLTRDLQALDQDEHPEDLGAHAAVLENTAFENTVENTLSTVPTQLKSQDAAETEMDSASPGESSSDSDSTATIHIESAEPARASEVAETSSLNKEGLLEGDRAEATQFSEPGEQLAEPKVEQKTRTSGSSEKDGDPPYASAFPLLLGAASRPTAGRLAMPVEPQFGPTYGMAPTGETLVPVSTLPDDIELPEPVVEQPRWMIPAGVAAGILGLIVLVFYFGPFRPHASSAPSVTPIPVTAPAVPEKQASKTGAKKKKTATQSPAASGATAKTSPTPMPAQKTSKPAAAAAVQTVAKQQAPALTPPPKPASTPTPTRAPIAQAVAAPASAGLRRATVKASGMNWISACSDGKPVFADLLKSGGAKDIDFHNTAVIRVGNAAAAEIFVDGKSVGALGAAGSVKILEISAGGVRPLPPDLSPDAECHSKP
jgi:hypothetical protein